MAACGNDDKGLGCEAMAREADAEEACEAGFGTEDVATTTGFGRAAAAAGAGRKRDNSNSSSSEEQDCSSATLRFPSTLYVSDGGAAERERAAGGRGWSSSFSSVRSIVVCISRKRQLIADD